MDTGWITAIALIGVAILCMLNAWRRSVERTRELDRWGMDYGVRRWENESNRSYEQRIYTRIDITGGKRNPW